MIVNLVCYIVTVTNEISAGLVPVSLLVPPPRGIKLAPGAGAGLHAEVRRLPIGPVPEATLKRR